MHTHCWATTRPHDLSPGPPDIVTSGSSLFSLEKPLPCERVCSRSLRYVDSHSSSLHLPCVRISFFLKAESYSIASCAALFSHSLLGGHGRFPPLLWLASTCFSYCCQLGQTNSFLTPCFQISEFHARSSCWILC